MMSESNEDSSPGPEDEGTWWSMSPKTQIIVFAVGIGLFNCLLMAILAAAFLLR